MPGTKALTIYKPVDLRAPLEFKLKTGCKFTSPTLLDNFNENPLDPVYIDDPSNKLEISKDNSFFDKYILNDIDAPSFSQVEGEGGDIQVKDEGMIQDNGLEQRDDGQQEVRN
mmetsp:Transcript_14829/g.12636  ORF Transcript_14829/g.12636 Transcript_14829/m.12636 type:complete len:113 (+) Transcript_14829:1691-2029(+)